MCWVIRIVVARSWAVSGRVIHNLSLSTICAFLAKAIPPNIPNNDWNEESFATEISHCFLGFNTALLIRR